MRAVGVVALELDLEALGEVGPAASALEVHVEGRGGRDAARAEGGRLGMGLEYQACSGDCAYGRGQTKAGVIIQ